MRELFQLFVGLVALIPTTVFTTNIIMFILDDYFDWSGMEDLDY